MVVFMIYVQYSRLLRQKHVSFLFPKTLFTEIVIELGLIKTIFTKIIFYVPLRYIIPC